jgi:hypothetical protein
VDLDQRIAYEPPRGNVVLLGGPAVDLRVEVIAGVVTWRTASVPALMIKATNDTNAVISAHAFGLEQEPGRGIVPACDLVTGELNAPFHLGPGGAHTFAIPARTLMAVVEDVAKCRCAIVYDRLKHAHRSADGELGRALESLIAMVEDRKLRPRAREPRQGAVRVPCTTTLPPGARDKTPY